MLVSTLILQHTSKKDVATEVVRYERNVRGYCNGSLPTGRRYQNMTLLFVIVVLSSTRRPTDVDTWVVTDLQLNLTPLFIIVDKKILVIILTSSYVWCLLHL